MKRCTCYSFSATRVREDGVILCCTCNFPAKGISEYNGVVTTKPKTDIESGPFPDLEMWKAWADAIPKPLPGQEFGKMIVYGTCEDSVTGSEHFAKMFHSPEEEEEEDYEDWDSVPASRIVNINHNKLK